MENKNNQNIYIINIINNTNKNEKVQYSYLFEFIIKILSKIKRPYRPL